MVKNPQSCLRLFDVSIFTNFDSSQYILLDQTPSMPEDFPCTHPGCDCTFKRPNNRTQHYNAHHRPLSPDSEPDPAHQFHIKYHPKLNGTFLFNFVEDSAYNTLQLCHAIRMENFYLNMLVLHLLLMMLQKTIHGTHSKIGSHLTGLTTTSRNFSHLSVKSIRAWTSGLQQL